MTYASQCTYREYGSLTERIGATLNVQTVVEDRPARSAADRLVPIAEASVRLRRSVWTLKRLFAKGHLPVTIIGTCWFVPESFIDLVFASMRPGQAADLGEVANAWFAANGYAEAAAS